MKLERESFGIYEVTDLSSALTALRQASEISGITQLADYTAVLVGDEIYLARQGKDGPEGWFCVKDAGVYVGQSRAYIPVTRDLTVPCNDGSTVTLSRESGGAYYCFADDDYYPIYLHARGTGGVGDRQNTNAYASDVYAYDEDADEYVPLGTQGLFFTTNGTESAYPVEWTGALAGGVRDIPCFIKAQGSALYFGTQGGHICVFNTDKSQAQVFRVNADYAGGTFVRTSNGIKPLSACPQEIKDAFVDSDGDVFTPSLQGRHGSVRLLKLSAASNLVITHPLVVGIAGIGEYAYVFEDFERNCFYPITPVAPYDGHATLHQLYYSFNGRAIRTRITTQRDDMSLPHVAKSTLHSGVILALETRTEAELQIYCGTDKHRARLIFDLIRPTDGKPATDLPCLSADDIGYLVIPERMRSYLWKQYTIASHDIFTPIGLYTLTHRFRTSRLGAR